MSKIYTVDDIRGALEHVDDMLRAIGFAANAGACTCMRCEANAVAAGPPARPADASAPSGGPGGALVAKPAPMPRGPRPGGNAVRVPVPALDEIAF
jgi:hypothetical protein